MDFSLIPEPRSIRFGGGRLPLKRIERVEASGLPGQTLSQVERMFPGVEVRSADGVGDCVAVMGPRRSRQRAEMISPSNRRQGYVLSVGKGCVQISARDCDGLWWGLATLGQMVEQAQSSGWLPEVEIHDWPAVSLRGVHLDLKGYQPKLAAMIDFARILSRHKINAILLEIEDKMVFKSAPGIAVDGAFDGFDLRKFAEECRSLFIEVIPKVQCLAHVDYLLKHDRYRRFREAGHPYQYCPRNEGGFELWKAMAGEVMAALPGGRYFHIGADEPANLGECPSCKKHSKADSYMHRVARCIDFVARCGRRPIMWDDILRNLHGHMSNDEARRTWELGRNAVLMYWAYGYGGKGNEFPFLPAYLDAGMEVWGASGASGCGPSWIQDIPPFEERASNIGAWAETAARFGLHGLVHTGWTKIASADPPAEPQEACWLPILYGAETTWGGGKVEPAAWVKKAARGFWGIPAEKAECLLAAHERALPPDMVGAARCQRHRWDLMCALSDLALHRAERGRLVECWQMYRRPLRLGRLADYRLEMVRGHVEQFERHRKERIRRAKAAMSRFYTRPTVAAFLESRFGVDEDIIAGVRALLGRVL